MPPDYLHWTSIIRNVCGVAGLLAGGACGVVDPISVVLNLTFLVTVGVGCLMFFVYAILFAGLLAVAAAAQLAGLIVAAVWKGFSRRAATCVACGAASGDRRFRTGSGRPVGGELADDVQCVHVQ